MSRYPVSPAGRIVAGVLGVTALTVAVAAWFLAPDFFTGWQSAIFVVAGLLSIYVSIKGAGPKFIEDDIKIFSDKGNE